MSITVLRSAAQLPPGTYLAPCAVSGGTLTAFLKSAMELAQGRLCVRIAPVYMALTLPCPTGQGAALTKARALELIQDRPRIFSPALCTNYTVFFQDGDLCAILMDTAETLRKKLQLAEAAGIPYALAEDSGVYALLTQN